MALWLKGSGLPSSKVLQFITTIELVWLRHSSHAHAIKPSLSVNWAGIASQMVSLEFWVQHCLPHRPHQTASLKLSWNIAGLACHATAIPSHSGAFSMQRKVVIFLISLLIVGAFTSVPNFNTFLEFLGVLYAPCTYLLAHWSWQLIDCLWASFPCKELVFSVPCGEVGRTRRVKSLGCTLRCSSHFLWGLFCESVSRRIRKARE